MSEQVELQTKLDAYKAMSEMRLEEQRKVDQLKKQETAMKDDLIGYLTEHPELNGIMGSTHKAVLKHSTVPIIVDPDALKAYITENDAWDIISYRASAPAIRERWDDSVEVPGIAGMDDTKLSVTKL